MSVVMGTAGHIDHGKTSLIKALTGTDCDRLAEEQKRGITIELGFAFLDLPGGARLSIVDVPGHERFVHTMMSGAAGIDFVLLVVAADEGIMPQTREHLEICTLLGLRNGIVALTKTDMVDEELLALAQEDVATLLKGTFLEHAPVFPVSAHTGAGLAELKAALAHIESHLAPSRRSDLLRLPVDRVFSVKGHGTVVTGTLISGQASVGEDVTLYPSLRQAKIRSLQSHGAANTTGGAGRRTAMNLHGLGTDEVERGEVVSQPDALFPSLRWIGEITCLPSSPRPLRNRKQVHFHHGARTMQARLFFPTVEQLAPGETAIGEIRFTEPAVGVFGDRFVIRSFSPLRTVAGGTLLHPLGVVLKKRQPDFAATYQALATLAESLHTEAPTPAGTGGKDSGKPPARDKGAPSHEENRTLAMLQLAQERGTTFAELCVTTNCDSRTLEKILGTLGGRQLALCTDREARLYHSTQALDALCASCLAFVAAAHAANAMKPGLSRGEIASGWGKKHSPKLLHSIVERLLKQGSLHLTGDMLHLPEHRVRLAADDEALRASILRAHQDGGMAPPNMKDVLEALDLSEKDALPLLKHMQNSKEITRVADGIWYATDALKSIEEQIRTWYQSNESLDLAGLKTFTGLSRKYLVALLEYFDKEKLTVRVGDKRILRK